MRLMAPFMWGPCSAEHAKHIRGVETMWGYRIVEGQPHFFAFTFFIPIYASFLAATKTFCSTDMYSQIADLPAARD